MRNRLVYICSPCRGEMEKNIIKAQGYCREAAELWPDIIPIAPHVYCTQFLDDTNPDERAVGMDMGISLLVLPSCSLNGIAYIESQTVRISGELIMDMAKLLKRNRGQDLTVEAEA